MCTRSTVAPYYSATVGSATDRSIDSVQLRARE
jgi:hypothetical protein